MEAARRAAREVFHFDRGKSSAAPRSPFPPRHASATSTRDRSNWRRASGVGVPVAARGCRRIQRTEGMRHSQSAAQNRRSHQHAFSGRKRGKNPRSHTVGRGVATKKTGGGTDRNDQQSALISRSNNN